MRYIADLHIHSHFSRATSKSLNLEHLNYWGQLKGLQLIATGDLSHPQWLQEMRDTLEPDQEGLYKLKPDRGAMLQEKIPASCRGQVRFILSGEISCIYKKGDRVRKVHHVVFLPNFDAVQRFQNRLEKIGNIRSDGRPILGLDSHDLLEILLESDEQAVLIPAHIWTPWFSLLGSKSGFLSVEECFEDLTPHIFALETGLSSDPPMNWRLTALDRYNLVSNSDAHSPEKLAREANIFDTELSYTALFAALRDKLSSAFYGTIEFFPEEGKYHFDGHRKCNCRMHPQETLANQGLCPICGKPAVLGVSYQVEQMADRPENVRPDGAKPFLSLVPLPEVLGDVLSLGPNSKKVQEQYHRLLHSLGPELNILIDCSTTDIERAGGVLIAEAIRRMRARKVFAEAGYDGEYGAIRIFQAGEREQILQQGALFDLKPETLKPTVTLAKTIPRDNDARFAAASVATDIVAETANNPYGLNEEQWQAVSYRGTPLEIQAGPGTGKTRTLVYRLAGLIHANEAVAEGVLSVTFTNRAADEMRERLRRLIGPKLSQRMHIQTFHALGAELLRELPAFQGRKRGFRIADPVDDEEIQAAFRQKSGKPLTSYLEIFSRFKADLIGPDNLTQRSASSQSAEVADLFRFYETVLMELNAVDYDDLIGLPVRILRQDPDVRRRWVRRFQIVTVDEFQDLNQAQYELFKLFALAAEDVCVIGDPDQAIYGFRGADLRFFSRFQQDFGAKVIRLFRNYRSAQNILDISQQLLDRDDGDRLWSKIDPLVKCRIYQAPRDHAEAEFIVQQIEQLVGGTSHFSIDTQRVDERGLPQDYGFSDLAILLRSKRQAPPLYTALNRAGIPFETLSDHRLSDHPLVRALSAAAMMLSEPGRANPLDLLTFYLPESEAQLILQQVRSTASGPNPWLSSLKTQTSSSPEWPLFLALLEQLQQLPPAAPLSLILATIWPHLRTRLPEENREALSIYRRVLELARPYDKNISAYRDQLLLHREIDALEKRSDRVHLLTLHAAKGLEFPVVFIPGCEDGILPLRVGDKPTDVAEERRLLYVGMTRAQSILLLTHARKRYWFGQQLIQTPSPFLARISRDLVEHQLAALPARRQTQLSLF